MPITYECSDQWRRISVRLSGVVAVGDLLAIVDRQAAEPTYERGLAAGQLVRR
jgi:hypothetical protein